MASGQLRTLLHHLRKIVNPPAPGGLSDVHLLERWVSRRDEAAFELLLWRHGPMVLSVCRRLLRHSQDVEDAFQATFLVLVQKAASIGKREAVGSWLYRVAFRIALRARTGAAKRAALNGHAADVPAPAPPDDLVWRDVGAVLDEEVSRLPERYRAAFVLCYLQGKTNEEAARELGCPPGTILSRLSRARERLRVRLTRRGLGLSAALLGTALSREAAAAVPASLIASTTRAVLLCTADQLAAAGVLSVQAAALTKGALHAMWVTKMKTAAAALLAVAVIGGSGGVFTYRTLAAAPGSAGQETEPARQAAGNEPAKEDSFRRDNERLKKELTAAQAKATSLSASLKASEQQLRRAEARLLRIHDDLLRKELEKVPRLPKIKQTDSRSAEAPPLGDFRAQPGSADDARDAVELLEAKLQVKRAELRAAEVSLHAAKTRLARVERFPSDVASEGDVERARQEVAGQEAQLLIKQAELREPEVLLRQARRRLANFQHQGKPAEKSKPLKGDEQLRKLDKKLQALQRELDALRRQLHPQDSHEGPP